MDPISQNIDGVRQLVGSGLNKTPHAESKLQEGPLDNERVDVLDLGMTDEELIIIKNRWENKYKQYDGSIRPRQNMIKAYYLGKQKEGSATVIEEPISSNLLFEAEETFLPAALAKNPEPVTWCDNTTEGTEISKSVKTMLQYHADTLNLRGALKLMVRQNTIYLIGVVKHGWDETIKDICLDTRKPQDFIFDPDGFVNRFGDYEGYLGEKIKVTAEELCDLFPKKRAYIIISVNGKMGTSVVYTEWWDPTDTFCFYTYKDVVLDKHKNQYYNYDESHDETDVDGNPQTITNKASNHFAKAKKPYTFLSVFSLEEHPHDMTTLIEQNIPNQRRITRRTEQIDYNLSRANNSDVFSENNFNQETAKQAARAFAKGNPVIVPKGSAITEAIHRLQAPGLDASFFTELETSKRDLRQIFGTEGITTNPQDDDKTVRGKIIDSNNDSTRIGGGVGDALEAVADNIFNWWVQLYYVFYDVPHYASILGGMRAVEFTTLKSNDLIRRVVVSVSPGSMKPKDEVTEMNQALELYQGGLLDPKTFFTIVDFPDPQKTAENTVLWMTDKGAYMQLNFPELSQQLAEMQQQAMAQMAAQGGGNINSEQANGEPAGGMSAPPPDPALSQVPINQLS